MKSGDIATLIKNTDLVNKYGADKIQAPFRIVSALLIFYQYFFSKKFYFQNYTPSLSHKTF
jgi:hypothetical protein